MRFHVPKSIPVIYGEALNYGSDILRKLAWHLYWMSREEHTDDEGGGKEDECIFEAPDPKADYGGLGLVMLIGCFENDVDGDYYGTDSGVERLWYEGDFRDEFVVFEKSNKDERGHSVRLESNNACYTDIWFRLCHEGNDSIYPILSYQNESAVNGFIPCDLLHLEKNNTSVMCFPFKRGEWFPLPRNDDSDEAPESDLESSDEE